MINSKEAQIESDTLYEKFYNGAPLDEFMADVEKWSKKNGPEIFLIESPDNHYKPAPPDGFFAIRSRSRRLFLPLENGKRYPDDIQKLIQLGEYTEVPLD